MIVENFAQKAKEIQNKRGVNGAENSSTLLQEEGYTIIHDVQLLSGLISAHSRIQEAHLFYDLMQNTNYVDRRIELMQSRIEEHKSIIGGFNAISELKNHAKQCVNEMNWFQRNFSSNSTVNKVNQIANLQDPFDTSTKTIDVVPSYCFWRDENGLNIKIDRSGQST